MKRRWIVWWGLLGTAGWLALFGDKTPSGGVVQDRSVLRPHASTQAPTSPHPQRSTMMASESLEALIPREQLVPMRAASQPADPFGITSWTPLPAPAVVAPPPPPPPPPPAAAPVVPYTVLGKKLDGGLWEVYLGRGELVLIAKAGATLDGTYRVDQVQPPTLTLTYLPLGLVQTVPIGESQ
jgi:hypothetical protein